MASVRLLLTTLSLICLFAPSQQGCKCEAKDWETNVDLNDGVKCNGTSDAMKCFTTTCKDTQLLFKNFVRPLEVFEKVACDKKIQAETKGGDCWEVVFTRCKDMVFPNKKDENEKACKEKSKEKTNCMDKISINSPQCKPLADKVLPGVLQACKSGSGALPLHLSLIFVASFVSLLSRW